ncbi:MAG: hypothetical protein A2328_00040 [Bdellovibrionales bacterium RIFOXYB2_FULL_36_6]|nr:MAG: hypothetical protein A2328_00040 [Bdellovibrionales bacterium RIFOXYB2_FULL_36_6]
MEANKFSPIKSDVHIFLEQKQPMFDTAISKVFSELKISKLLRDANIEKRTGIATVKVVYDLFHIPFLMLSTVCLFVRNQFEDAVSKNVYYRFLENAKYNWCLFIMNLSCRIEKKISEEDKSEKMFVVDDTITEITGRMVEGASYIFDHTIGKSVLGFQKLVLGIFSNDKFLPISEKICPSSKKPTKKSKATKYLKTAKANKIRPDSPGAIARADMDKNKLEKTLAMLKDAKRKFRDVTYALYDSWFAFNSFILDVKSLGLDSVCQLKNMPKANKYEYNGKNYSLKALFCIAESKMRTVKKMGYKQAVITVLIPNTDLHLKIVFVHNEGELSWHAFASTNIKLNAKKILEIYSKRWSIEVFFKNCKQYLNFGKEQMSNLDSIIASDALVFMRYLMLTYLSSCTSEGFFDVLEKNRINSKMLTYGMRLLNYFLNQLKYYIDCVCGLIEEGKKDEAIELLKNIFTPHQIPQLNFVVLK